ncbi:MAG: GH3 auxin-responsive promoter family protein [Bacteroidetes bacterium]|nr:GH3 auxin-responsive promoter family protein [Bacteroidota bacterium]
MPILGSIIKGAINFRGKIPSRKNFYKQQLTQLKKLMAKAEFTDFGKRYHFGEILLSEDPIKTFQSKVPIHDYQSIFDLWWHRTLKGEKNVCWPGKIKYFALSSGTSESSSKHLPITKELIKTIQRTTLSQVVSTRHLSYPKEQYETEILFITGSSNLNFNGVYFSGDLSGITAGTQPRWFQNFTLPGPEILSIKIWEEKIQEIVERAKDWNIGFIAGVPAWIQIIFERIIKYYNVKTIHDIWPNLVLYVHGGVAIHPYKKSIDALCGKKIDYLDTYMASEGFFAYQERPNPHQAMKLVVNNKMFFEFVPFNNDNFDSDGNIKPNAKALSITEVDVNIDYALLLSNCAGAWRYLIGDTIKFTDIERGEIVITGRTKHFLSLCGEHLSVDNMNQAIKIVSDEMGIVINEYCVTGIPYQGLFAHHWYIGTDSRVDPAIIKTKLDEALKTLNDDYIVERKHALKELIITILPNQTFIDFLAFKGKLGAQSKIPRVMKGKHLNDWQAFIKDKI